MLVGKIKEVKFLPDLIGKKLPPKDFGQAGRALEDMFEQDYGITVNRRKGPDNRMFGIEYKTRDLDSTSPQTVATMNVEDIIKTPYRESEVFKKFQQQIRVKTKDNIIVEADLYDFRPPHIQEKIEAAYENARAQFSKNKDLQITKSGPESIGYWGYFENTSNRESSRSFRISPNAMEDYENMAKSNFTNIFDYGN
jgi:hypothetical protein